MRKKLMPIIFSLMAILFSACGGTNDTILNNLEEKEANIIVVF